MLVDGVLVVVVVCYYHRNIFIRSTTTTTTTRRKWERNACKINDIDCIDLKRACDGDDDND